MLKVMRGSRNEMGNRRGDSCNGKKRVMEVNRDVRLVDEVDEILLVMQEDDQQPLSSNYSEEETGQLDKTEKDFDKDEIEEETEDKYHNDGNVYQKEVEAELEMEIEASGPRKRCKCSPTGYQRQPEDLPENVHYPCIAVDTRYKLLRPCLRRATEVLVYRGKERIYCKTHELLFRAHRQCRYCDCFCYQGEFTLCESDESEAHWTCSKCCKDNWMMCSHCGGGARHSQQFICIPEKNALFRYLASQNGFEVNTGRQLNLLSICCDEFESVAAQSSFVEAILTTDLNRAYYCKVKTLYEAVKSADYSELICAILKLRKCLEECGGDDEETRREFDEGILAALERDDNQALALIMQYIGMKPTLMSLSLAVERGNARAVNVLILHNALALLEYCDNINGADDFNMSDVITMLLHDIIIAGNNPKGLEVILNSNMVNICEENAQRETILHLLAKSGNAKSIEMAKVLFSNSDHITKPYLDMKNVDGETAAMVAFQAQNWGLLKIYLENGASPEGIPGEDCNSSMKIPHAINVLIERFRAELKLKRLIPDPVRYIERDLSLGRERYPITVENCMGDGAELDADFEYSNVVLNMDCFRGRIDFSLGCHCVDECHANCSCITSPKCTLIYDCNYRLTEKACELAQTNELGIVTECNSTCFCSPHCRSRVAQTGIRQRLQIYRSTRYGWAVRCATAIRKGEFICEYAGELIRGSEADQCEDDTYIFEILTEAENDGLISYCVDARRRGNVSRFINHSCEPNLCAVRIVWDAATAHFPHICLFAKRNIAKGEELTMDYGKQWWDVKLRYFACQCGSRKCIYGEDAGERLLDGLSEA